VDIWLEHDTFGDSKTSVPAVLGVGDKIGEGDTYLPPELAEVVFEN
jgi:hypothetical protein